jgi:lipopolysaccharide/colanic/teichoic acid biosynthesis glycosyltransferase
MARADRTTLDRRGGDGLKRGFDVVMAACGLVVLALPMLAIAITVRLSMGSPVLFRQPRPGRHGRPFTLVKFRTMKDATDTSGRPLPDDQRITRTGRLLRRTSLDEIPELWNILRGDMSLVGPRPLLLEYLPLYDADQRRRHEVRPGLTGLAQVRGRRHLDMDARLALDVWYVDHRSVRLDLRIIRETLVQLAGHDGVEADPLVEARDARWNAAARHRGMD